MSSLISIPKSVIPACDFGALNRLGKLAEDVAGIPGIGALKLGLEGDIPHGLEGMVREIISTDFTGPIIYDRQKAGTDIPDLGPKFAKAVRMAGADAAILFPLSGPKTQEIWTQALLDEGIVPIIGGEMTHPQFLVSDGGYIADDAPKRIYGKAVEQGVRNFVVPGNKADKVAAYYQLLKALLGDEPFALYAPGFVAQEGIITEAGKVAGPNWHAIVGRAIYEAEDMAAAAQLMVSQILAT